MRLIHALPIGKLKNTYNNNLTQRHLLKKQKNNIDNLNYKNINL